MTWQKQTHTQYKTETKLDPKWKHWNTFATCFQLVFEMILVSQLWSTITQKEWLSQKPWEIVSCHWSFSRWIACSHRKQTEFDFLRNVAIVISYRRLALNVYSLVKYYPKKAGDCWLRPGSCTIHIQMHALIYLIYSFVSLKTCKCYIVSGCLT